MDRVTAACAACFGAHAGDCSGFARAVAARLDVPLDGLANDIADTLRQGAGGWSVLADGMAAAASAREGKLVLAGLRGDQQAAPSEHGHVVVVVPGPLAHNAYPTAWWGSLGGTPGRGETLNWAWTYADRDRVAYAAHEFPSHNGGGVIQTASIANGPVGGSGLSVGGAATAIVKASDVPAGS